MDQQEPDDRTDEQPARPLPSSGDTESSEQAPPRLERSSDRILFGVASGLGDYFKVDPLIIRIGLVVSIFFGGLGILAYIGFAIFTPSAESESIGDGRRGLPGGFGGVFLAIVIAIGALIAFGVISFSAFVAASFGRLELVAVAIALFGIALVALARQGRGRWMALPLIALVAGGLCGAALDLDLDGGIGEEIATPQTLAAIPDEGYNQGIGLLAVDLRRLDWGARERLDISADLGFGELVVVASEDTCIRGEAHVRVGEITFAGEGSEGIEQEVSNPPTEASDSRGASDRGGQSDRGDGPERTLVVDADAEIGEILVVADDEVDIEKVDQADFRDLGGALNGEACAG